ncbi:unnamed protein product [Litomosoides sigmodontis]|uniref:Uncharacterized protein n=1 Tax=Litomosoides sigmodontis TaxID=42156 RepID=A0A3P6T1F4_LITSI|nr:unnamed protein product [Litomosoides sigmodontis]
MLCRCFCLKSQIGNSCDVPMAPIARAQNSVLKDTVEQRIPLTEKQKYVLIKNWKGIDREVTAAGTEMFIR